MDQYKRSALRTSDYVESCELAFKTLGLVLVAVLVAFAIFDWVRWFDVLTIMGGAALYGGSAIVWLHTQYHLKDSVLKRKRVFKSKTAWRLFLWLRKCHDAHHIANVNFFILNPLPDILFGTFVPASKVDNLEAEDLFPSFDPKLSSSCGTPVFGKRP